MTLYPEWTGDTPETKNDRESKSDTDTIESLAHRLAQDTGAMRVMDGKPLPILTHTEKLQERLHQAYLHFAQEAQTSLVVSYGGEWLLDNYYIIQRTVQQIAENMPPRYYKHLPKIEHGPFTDYAHVYALAHALSHFLHSRLTIDDQSRFIDAYQQHTTFTIGELWAWPTLLRITILENLIVALDQAMQVNGSFARGLVTPAVQEQYPLQVDEDIIIANCVTSLRAIDAYDWSEFVEDFSYVEAILRQDPYDIYPQMDFETRDRYRQQVEKLAARSDQTEDQVARSVLELARHEQGLQEIPTVSAPDRTAHVGYYLVDAGLRETKRTIGYRYPLYEIVAGWLKDHALFMYLCVIWLMAAVIIFIGASYAAAFGGSALQVAVVVLLLSVPSISVATHLVNWVISKLVSPSTLPKMDFNDDIPEAYRSFVVIPALLTNLDEVQSLVNQVEQHYLRNTDDKLYFAILADFPDADQEEMPEDRTLTERAVEQMNALNGRYGADNRRPFYFFMRKRRWNAAEQKWMGYERKRGKLAEFNRLLLDPQAETSYIIKLGDLHILGTIRYVITLDADTILPPDGARRLVGTLAHPLNQAHFDESGQHVTSGYTVLQPRVEILPATTNQTAFTRIFAGERGLDLYTLAVSDVYQDLFGEGSYVGKGIYDVAAFERSLEGRTPTNALLSHDLFEGLHGRAGLVTDIVLLEDYPTHYLAHVDRVHRWVRGDWQLLPWLLPRVPSSTGESVPNRFSLLDKWKILDNLIRSLFQPALIITILLSWFWLPGTAVAWTVFAVLVLFVPFLITIFNQVDTISLQGNFGPSQQRSLVLSLTRWALSIAFLPYEALVRLDAIWVTLRRLRQRKHLLEWKTAASVLQMYQRQSTNLVQQRMLGVVIIAAVLAIIAFLMDPTSIIVSLPLVAAWFSGPILAQRISQPIEAEPQIITDQQRHQLRTLARRTWLFFEEYIGPNDHWLPPDHYQQSPIDKVGHYTSPTNIGLMLVAIVAAYDQGYIGLLDMLTRLQFAFESITQLERYRGHLLNWYSTTTLLPLRPRYVSTVDNGNFAACLLILQSTFDGLPGVSLLRPQRWQGVLDTLSVLEEIMERIQPLQSSSRSDDIKQQLAAMREPITRFEDQPAEWITQLDRMNNQDWDDLNAAIVSLSEHIGVTEAPHFHDLRVYLSRLRHHLNSFRRDLDLFAPWLAALSDAPPYFANADDEASKAWQRLLEDAQGFPLFGSTHDLYQKIEYDLNELRDSLGTQPEHEDARAWRERLCDALEASRNAAADLTETFRVVREATHIEFNAMSFGFLYNSQRHLFHIGYNVDNEQLDNSYYDMLASEARVASFLSIAKRDVSQKHWLHLSRPVTLVDNVQTLLSWSGTMFEYLMPLLFMRNYPNTLLHQSYRAVVEHQVQFGKRRKVPWGVSESGYYAFDSIQNYQYRAFGLPELGFRREQAREVVITPYASVLALPLAPAQVAENIHMLADHGALTIYGLVEAVDFTASRLPLGREFALVKEYMAHHQGMIFISLANYLNDNLMVERFHRNPLVESVELLLMEQISQELSVEANAESAIENKIPISTLSTHPWEVATETSEPQSHYLSNGHYSVMVTGAGSGYSQWNTRAITRWRADTTLDNWGQWLYLYEEPAQNLWSPTLQPLGRRDQMKVIFHLSRVEFQSRAYDISSNLEILIPPDHDLEIRTLTLTNHTEDDRILTVCSYGEMVMAPQNIDQRHQTFNKMFIESEYLPDLNALLFRRRLRAVDDRPMYVIHMLLTPDAHEDAILYETDRKRFLGRNRTYRNPAAFDTNPFVLSGTTGATLDPIMAIAQSVEIPAHSTAKIAYVTLAAASREEALALAGRYQVWDEIDRAKNQSRYKGERELRQLGLSTDDIARYQTLLSSLLYPNPRFRASAQTLESNTKAQPGLWAYGVSGDYPIALVQINNEEQLDIVHEMVMAHRFWRNRGFASTLVILNQSDAGYRQELYNQIHRLLIRTGNETWINRHDGIFILRAEQLNDADRILLRTAARVLLDGSNGSLQAQLDLHSSEAVTLPPLTPTLDDETVDDNTRPFERPSNLLFDNGYGGFTEDGHEYQIFVDGDTELPLPWINVIANPHGGFIVSETGGGFSWAENSGEHRLTAWRNDPVTDMPAEAIYLRDEETTSVWSPTPLPARTDAPYLVRHGAGYTVFEHQSHGLSQTTRLYMTPDDPVKFVRVRLKNTASRPRRITITYYAEWVLGPLRDMTQQYLIPEFDPAAQTVMVHNPYSMEFGKHHAFITADRPLHGWTTARTEFLGTHGSLEYPAALRRIGLSSTVRSGLDTCAALQVHVDLPVDGEEEICFVIGSGETRAAALELSQQYRARESIDQAWYDTRSNWRQILDSIVVRTPDQAMNLLLPWLLYQALSCRIWGRSALYQSSGAYGFRDQLQDVMALIHVRPDLAREHILRAARHQFEEGDVLHWWHPPSGRGVRTRFSDDLVWLPYVVSHYVTATGDHAVLDAEEPFLRGEVLRPEEEERYGFYETTSETYSIYEHCRRALNKAYSLGRHNLPLMKAGDWNDGMNRVGIEGEGESVWMGWFLYTTMDAFTAICAQRDETLQSETYRQWMHQLKTALENAAWDGRWYRRAYYDDGTPLGSVNNIECQIDSLPQSWGVLSGAADKDRIDMAMTAVDDHLIQWNDQLIQLFTPPFNHTEKDPGYIKGYPPGIRENGGQYTHAALWVVWAFAEMGRGDMAESLFRLLNPIYHSDTPDKADLYSVEPYVVAADVYSTPPHTGHGGWTWYTGSSGWMYRLGIEAILGLHREGAYLRIEPRTRSGWERYEVDYRYGDTTYHIEILNPDGVENGVREVQLDGQTLESNLLPLVDDGVSHQVTVVRGHAV